MKDKEHMTYYPIDPRSDFTRDQKEIYPVLQKILIDLNEIGAYAEWALKKVDKISWGMDVMHQQTAISEPKGSSCTICNEMPQIHVDFIPCYAVEDESQLPPDQQGDVCWPCANKFLKNNYYRARECVGELNHWIKNQDSVGEWNGYYECPSPEELL